MKLRLIATFLLLAATCGAAEYKAGAARVNISPRESIWMGGYAARKRPSTDVAQDLWVKALAIEDAHGHRVVILTMDLLRVPRLIVEPLAQELKGRYGIERSELLLNCAHNHSGPSPWENDPFTAMAPQEYAKCRRYTESLKDAFATAVGEALRNMAPAAIFHGTGEAGFAANRRVKTAKGYDIGYNPDGPVDHRVPVLEVVGKDGRLIAVLFGYACHNTTVEGSCLRINGDYAGYAQADLEQAHPGAVALFMQLCAGDQDPHPRGGLEIAAQHGKELSGAVEKVLNGKLAAVHGRIGTALQMTDLDFAPHTREQFEKRLNDPLPARVRNARAMLAAYDAGHPIRSIPYPVQAVTFGHSLSLLALGGEPVIDYALRARREFPNAIVLGYSNLVRSYVPSRRVLAEGGYEPEESMLYYGLPGPYAPDVEDRIFSAIGSALKQAGGRR